MVKQQIGAGSFGEVFLVSEGATGREFAMKRVRRAKVVKGREADEASLLGALSCPFVVGLVAAWEDATAVTLVMEHLPGGELFLLLRQVGAMEEQQARFYVSQVVLALEHLHGLGVVYRDLKPENILLDRCGLLKLVDFGFAKRLAAGRRSWTLCGTPEYLAPEVILARGAAAPADCWALGVLAWELAAGAAPYGQQVRDKWRQVEVYEAVLAGLPPRPAHFSPSLRRLVEALLAWRPEERMTAAGARSSTWLRGVDWGALWGRTAPAPYLPTVQGAAVEYCWNFPNWDTQLTEL